MQEVPDEDRPFNQQPLSHLDTTDDFTKLVAYYESVDRINWQKPSEVINKLGDLSDKTIVDLGSGTGYFTFRFIPLAASVIAVDIDERMIDFIERHRADIPETYNQKLEVRQAKPQDPNIGNKEADIVFLANTYSYIENRISYFRRLKSKLKPNGKITIVEYKKKQIPVGPPQDQRLPLYIVEQEMEKAGYKIMDSDDRTLPFQYILTVTPK
jgi:SAM-dependent methyltransferase